MTSSAPALILAGGQACRMGGGDKTLLLLGGRPILAHVLDRLRPDHDRIAISANGDPARFAAFGLPVLPDDRSFGPLAGLHAGLRWAGMIGADRLLTVPGDGPFLPRRLADRLDPGPSLAESDGRRHPTVALWPAWIEDALARHLASLDPTGPGSYSVISLAERVGARVVRFDTDALDPFFNINTPGDLALAEATLSSP